MLLLITIGINIDTINKKMIPSDRVLFFQDLFASLFNIKSDTDISFDETLDTILKPKNKPIIPIINNFFMIFHSHSILLISKVANIKFLPIYPLYLFGYVKF